MAIRYLPDTKEFLSFWFVRMFLCVSLFDSLVVSSGCFHAFHVIFVPLEYIPTIHPHSTYVIVMSQCLTNFVFVVKIQITFAMLNELFTSSPL